MPKTIPNLREKLLEAGRTLLFSEGYNGLTMRKVADVCMIGLGTCYNYFESKDILVANIMLDDWNVLLRGMRESFQYETEPIKKARTVYEVIKGFSLKYEDVWSQYAGSGHAVKRSFDRHGMLIGQLMDVSGLSKFVTELLVHFATVDDMDFEEMEPEIKKLL